MSTNESHSYCYDELFYEYQRKGSARSAHAVLPCVVNTLGVRSVLDVGCGAGAWLAEYNRLGVADFDGVDGDYVKQSVLLIDPARFISRDITRPFDLGRPYDLVQCLEVAEHVQTKASRTLVENIVRHAKRVLFSAAVPGQGGENHINEQPYEFWRNLFRERGYRLFDFVRPAVQGATEAEPWYRYNILFFAHDDIIGSLPTEVVGHGILDGMAIKDFSPMSYQIRKTIMRLLPNRAVSQLAVIKHKLALRSLERQKMED